MEFPTLVYKDRGPHQRPGGTYAFMQVVDQADADAAFAAGWHESLALAVDPDNAPPTRSELETKAGQLGIKFDGRTTDKALQAKIEAALAGA